METAEQRTESTEGGGAVSMSPPTSLLASSVYRVRASEATNFAVWLDEQRLHGEADDLRDLAAMLVEWADNMDANK